MASITQEQALAELKARGVDPSNPQTSTDQVPVNTQDVVAELQRRGVQIPKAQEPSLNSSFQPSPDQQKQMPISSMITKGLGVGMEGLSAPFQVAGEAIRGAGAGEPLKVATAQDPQGFRAPTILQRFMPSLRTPQAPSDPFTQAAMGLKGIATTAANLPQGIGPAIQAGAQAVQGPPGLAENIGSTAMALGTGEAGNIPFTAAIKPFTALGKLLETGELAGIPGTGMAGKAASGMDAVPLGLENLTAHANPEVLEQAAKNNVPLTPAGVTGSPTLASIEGFLRKLPFSSNVMQERFAQQLDALGKVREPIVEATKPASDLGLDVQQGLSNASNANMGKAKALYANVENTLPQNAQIPISNIKSAAADLSSAQSKLPPGARASGASQILGDLADKKGPSAMDYQTLQALRSELNSRISQANSALRSASPGASFQATPEVRMYSQLKDAVDKDLNAFSDKTGGAFQSAYSEANKTYQTYKQTYANDKFVQSILNEQNPENIVNKVVKAATDNPRALGTLKLNLPTNTLNDLQTYFIKNMTEKDPNIFSPSHFVSQYNSIGESKLNDILGPDKVAQLRPLYVLSKASVNAEKLGQSATGPSGAGMVAGAMGLTQPLMMAMRNIAQGHPMKGAAMAAGMIGAEMEGLPMLAKAYLSKPVGKVLTRQIGMTPSFPTLGQIAPTAGKVAQPINSIAQNPQAQQILMNLLQRLKQGQQ